jgi:hypothetical protein
MATTIGGGRQIPNLKMARVTVSEKNSAPAGLFLGAE